MQKVMDRHEIRSDRQHGRGPLDIGKPHLTGCRHRHVPSLPVLLNTDTWWGVRNDTFTTHDEITRLGIDEFIAVGDKDRAVHIARGEMMRNGMRLTNATKILCERFGRPRNRAPDDGYGSDNPGKDRPRPYSFPGVLGPGKGKIEIQGVVRSSNEPPVATEEVLATIEASDAVVIGPSNPITSISPILACDGAEARTERQVRYRCEPVHRPRPRQRPAAP